MLGEPISSTDEGESAPPKESTKSPIHPRQTDGNPPSTTALGRAATSAGGAIFPSAPILNASLAGPANCLPSSNFSTGLRTNVRLTFILLFILADFVKSPVSGNFANCPISWVGMGTAAISAVISWMICSRSALVSCGVIRRSSSRRSCSGRSSLPRISLASTSSILRGLGDGDGWTGYSSSPTSEMSLLLGRWIVIVGGGKGLAGSKIETRFFLVEGEEDVVESDGCSSAVL